MTETIRIGQKVYRKIDRRGLDTIIDELTVSKIGNKYFYVQENDRYKFDLKTLTHTDPIYSQSSFKVYTSLKEINDIAEAHALADKIMCFFRSYQFKSSKYTIDELENIIKVLKID